MIFIDGACTGNPGMGAGAACFFDIKNSSLVRDDDVNDDDYLGNFEDSSSSSDENDDNDEGDNPHENLNNDISDMKLDYICSSSINMGYTTNNMAEYTGLLLALMICSINKVDHISIRTDSELIVKQVKGINAVRNARLVYVMPIVHDLIKHFKSVQLDWITRDQNSQADKVARDAAKSDIGRTFKNPDLFKIKF